MISMLFLSNIVHAAYKNQTYDGDKIKEEFSQIFKEFERSKEEEKQKKISKQLRDDLEKIELRKTNEHQNKSFNARMKKKFGGRNKQLNFEVLKGLESFNKMPLLERIDFFVDAYAKYTALFVEECLYGPEEKTEQTMSERLNSTNVSLLAESFKEMPQKGIFLENIEKLFNPLAVIKFKKALSEYLSNLYSYPDTSVAAIEEYLNNSHHVIRKALIDFYNLKEEETYE